MKPHLLVSGFYLLINILIGHGAFAQTATLRGFITDESDGQALELVNVILEGENAEIVSGVVSRTDGFYQIRNITPGTYVIRASFIGYAGFSDTLSLLSGEIRTLNISLNPDEGELDELVVEAAPPATIAAPVAGLQTVRSEDLDRVPTPDVSGDLVSYLSILPGIVTTGDQGGQLFIRGGEPSQNLVLIDGMRVYQPFHVLGFYSAFPSDLISKADIYAGGFGAKYGGRLSSVLDIKTREGNNRAFNGTVGISPFLGSFLFEGPVFPGRVSLLASFRHSLVDRLAVKYINDDFPLSFYDAYGKLHIEVSSKSKLSLSYLNTEDRGILLEEEPADEIRWGNEAFGFRYLFLPRSVAAVIDFRFNHSRFYNTFGIPGEPQRESAIKNTHAILEASFVGERVDINAGFDLLPISISNELGGLYQNLEVKEVRLGNWGNYLEADIKIGSDLHLIPSLRAQFYKVRFNPFLEPRFRVSFKKGIHQFSASTGIHHQEVIGLTDRRDVANVFSAWVNIPKVSSDPNDVTAGRIQKAVHGILGYSAVFGNDFRFSAEGYYKQFSNLFIAEWTAFPRFTTRIQPAKGRSAGYDIRLSMDRGSRYVHINYAYSATRYTALQASIPIWYGTEGLDFRPPHDRRHQANLLVGLDWKGFDFSARFTFGSGLPFSKAIGFDGFALIDDVEDIGRLPSSRRVIYEQPFNSQLPAYHRLDLSVEKKIQLGRVDLSFQASVINTYNRSNIFYLDVFTLRRVDQLPVIPALGLKVDFQ